MKDIDDNIRAWHRRCLIWEVITLAVLSVLIGAATAVAV